MKLGLRRPLPKEVWRIARRVRQEILEENNGSSFAMCADASWRLHQLLQKAGFPSRVCGGEFYTDLDGFGRESHYWVRFHRAILDITADQFNNDIESSEWGELPNGKQTQMAAIVYGTNSELERRYKEDNKH